MTNNLNIIKIRDWIDQGEIILSSLRRAELQLSSKEGKVLKVSNDLAILEDKKAKLTKELSIQSAETLRDLKAQIESARKLDAELAEKDKVLSEKEAFLTKKEAHLASKEKKTDAAWDEMIKESKSKPKTEPKTEDKKSK